MKSRLLGAVSACAITFVSQSAQAVPVTGQGTWETTLQGRDLDGNTATFEAYYDAVLDITWLADTNYSVTEFANSGGTKGDDNGQMNWAEANAWAADLDFNGVTGWRLPETNPIDGNPNDFGLSHIGTADRGNNISAPGTLYAGSTASEMAHMFHNTLGNLGRCKVATSTTSTCDSNTSYGLSNTGPFSNLRPEYTDTYWSATEFTASNDPAAWYFAPYHGYQTFNFKSWTTYYAWAVHDGSVGVAVSSVPIPAAFWLFASGLLGLVGIARRKKAA